MVTKHTSGPWSHFDRNGVVEVVDADGNPVVHWSGFDASDKTLPERRANARLIAKAPEMLKGLEKAIEQLEGWVNWKCAPRHKPEHYRFIDGLKALCAEAQEQRP